jgi:hypothetical protein
MQMNKETPVGNKNPLFLRFINRESGVMDLLSSFSRVEHDYTAKAAVKAMQDPPDLESFRQELEEAVRDVVREGPGPEFSAFVNHYMEPSLMEEKVAKQTPRGENRMQVAYVKDDQAPWIQGLVCYNLCLYIKAFGTGDLKACRVCDKIFSNKGEYAVYCSEGCKRKKDMVKK